MKVTANGDGSELSSEVVEESDVQQTTVSKSNTVSLMFGLIDVNVNIASANYDDGKFEAKINVKVGSNLPSFDIALDDPAVAQALFVESKNADFNRNGIKSFIVAGIENALKSAFDEDKFNRALELADEKLKSKVNEIYQIENHNGSIKASSEVVDLVTSATDVSAVSSEQEQMEDISTDLKAQGYSEHSILEDDDNDDLPANYKPLSDGTSSIVLRDEKEDVSDDDEEDEGSIVSVAKLKY